MAHLMDGNYGSATLSQKESKAGVQEKFLLTGNLTEMGFRMLGELTGSEKDESPFRRVFMTKIEDRKTVHPRGFIKGVGYNI